MSDTQITVTRKHLRFARMYCDGSFNINRGDDNEEIAIRRLSGSTDDEDTQLVEVEIRVVRWLANKGLSVVPRSDLVRDALEQAMDCIRGETPEDCTPEEAREDTLQKLRDAMNMLESADAE